MKKNLDMFQFKKRTFQWNGSYTNNLSWGSQYMFSLYSMQTTKAVLYNLVGDCLHSFVLYAPISPLEKNTNKTKKCKNVAWKSNCCRRWGKAKELMWEISRTWKRVKFVPSTIDRKGYSRPWNSRRKWKIIIFLLHIQLFIQGTSI